jgi:putative endonuclease
VTLQKQGFYFMFFVYAIYSKAFDKIYIGSSSNPEGRLLAHNHPENKGWTKKFQPWMLFHSEEFSSKSDALKREKQLKSFQGRKFLRNLIENLNEFTR